MDGLGDVSLEVLYFPFFHNIFTNKVLIFCEKRNLFICKYEMWNCQSRNIQDTHKCTMPTLSDILSIFLGHLKAQKLKAKLT